jgi:hypothetical protein
MVLVVGKGGYGCKSKKSVMRYSRAVGISEIDLIYSWRVVVTDFEAVG